MSLELNELNVIGMFHFCIYVFMFFVQFSFNVFFLWIHTILSLAVLLHWYTNEKKCFLTELESKICGVSANATLSSKLLSPLLDPTEDHDTLVALTFAGVFISVIKISLVCAFRESPELSQ